MSRPLILIHRFGLGLLVGAVLQQSAAAQDVPPPRADTAQADSLRLRQIADSIARGDTLRAPIPSYVRPPVVDDSHTWRGQEILATGAHSLAELIERVPGATGFRAGFVVSPSGAAYMGCFTCVRVYLDGVELPALNPRTGGILDFAEIQLAAYDEVRIERGATELRVFLRSWGVDRTIPFTRLDISEGNNNTNTLRGLFGKRYRRGEVLQLSGQRVSSNDPSGSGSQSSLHSRVGLVKETWAVDAFAIRSSFSRDAQDRLNGLNGLAAFEGSRLDAYIRATVGRRGAGNWLQAIASTSAVRENTPGSGPAPPGEDDPPPPPADTSRSQAQYVLATGATLAGISTLASARLRVGEGERTNELSLTASTSLAGIFTSAFARRDTRDSALTLEAGARAYPIPSLSLSVGAGRRSGIGSNSASGQTYANAEASVRILGAWLTAGAMIRGSGVLLPPVGFDETLGVRNEEEATGGFARLSGRLWRSVHADVMVTQWDSAGWYRPERETRASLFLDSSWLTRFPSGSFHVRLGSTLENRTDTSFPTGEDGLLTSPGFSSISFFLELRIVSAVLSLQMRNIRGDEFTQVPGFVMPRRGYIYGVRWVLWH